MSGGGVRCLIGLGANIGDRRTSLEGAVRCLGRLPQVTLLGASTLIETQPVGGPPGQPDFLNGVAEIETGLSARALLEALLGIERDAGRDRTREVAGGPRSLDLDLLTYGAEQISEEDLIVPHPRLEERTFVLEPLAELLPHRRLPRCGLTVSQRLAELRGGPAAREA